MWPTNKKTVQGMYIYSYFLVYLQVDLDLDLADVTNNLIRLLLIAFDY